MKFCRIVVHGSRLRKGVPDMLPESVPVEALRPSFQECRRLSLAPIQVSHINVVSRLKHQSHPNSLPLHQWLTHSETQTKCFLEKQMITKQGLLSVSDVTSKSLNVAVGQRRLNA